MRGIEEVGGMVVVGVDIRKFNQIKLKSTKANPRNRILFEHFKRSGAADFGEKITTMVDLLHFY
jgi:hypothetical protein